MGTLVLTRPVIAITGSSGKTTTKEMLASILKRRWNVFKAKANHNLVTATRAHAKQITASHQAVVLEYATAGPGVIKRHCQVIKPNIGIITNIGTAHIGNFGGSVKRLAAAKSELIRHMDQKGVLVINADDPGSAYLDTGHFGGRIITVGIIRSAVVKGRNIQYTSGGMSFEVMLENKWHLMTVPFFGEHNVYNALQAVAVAHHLGFSVAEIREGLARCYHTRRRLFVRHSARGVAVIDDSYSANPDAVKAAIEVLIRVGQGKKVLVLGDMLELGSYSTRGHKEVGRFIAGRKIDLLCTLGSKARLIGEEAVAAGFSAEKVKHFSERAVLHAFLSRNLQKGDTVLVKGSHQTEMSKTADYLAKKSG